MGDGSRSRSGNFEESGCAHSSKSQPTLPSLSDDKRGSHDGKHRGHRSKSDSSGRPKQKGMSEKDLVHQMRLMKAYGDRNPFGGVFEGNPTFHRINHDYARIQGGGY